jgi:flagellar biosynthesis protein FlhA
MIVQNINGLEEELPVITLAPRLEQLLQQAAQMGEGGPAPVEPGLAERLQQSLASAAANQDGAGQPAVLLVSDLIRAMLARFIRQRVPNLHVLAYGEVHEVKRLRVVATVS